MPSFEDTLSSFRIAKRRGNHIQAYCPCHNDKNASLSIFLSDNKMLLYCHAGCQIEDILKTAHLTYQSLFLDTKPPTAIYQYRKPNGSLSHEKVKFKTEKGKRFTQRRIDANAIVENLDGVARIPYNYPDVLKAIKQGSPILYCEGEADCETARLLGYTATTMGGASDWRDEYKGFFKNTYVFQIPDKDKAGLALTSKVTASLKDTAKSLKVLILPSGNDLTEWVELGNSDLNPLIDASTELVVHNGIPEPTVKIAAGEYTFDWNGLGLRMVLNRIRNDNEGELSVYDNDRLIYISGIKLLSVSHKTALARALKTQRQLGWDSILNQIATRSLADMRKGEPVIWLNDDFGKQRPEYLIYPLFVKNAANIIYADKSSAKSLFMILISLILNLGLDAIGLKSGRHPTLYLDWENDPAITGWVKECLLRGLELEEFNIPYLRCSRPLVDCVDHIREKIEETGADTIIIDSLGMAVGDDLNITKPAFHFYAALRELNVTPIIIAHTSKDILAKRKTVYGNAYYENEARSVFEITKEQQFSSPELTITLHHRKAPPFAGYHEPLAWRFIFDGDTTKVETATPQIDKRESTEERTIEDKILGVLMVCDEHLTPANIVEESKGTVKEGSIKTTLVRMLKKRDSDIGKDNDGKYYYLP